MMDKELKAEWAMDYDFRTDSCYNRPSCPECREPIVKQEDGEYFCLSCGRNVKVTDQEMQDWFNEREAKYIDAKKLKSSLSETCDNMFNILEVMQMINETPSVNVVRCKDCIYFSPMPTGNMGRCCVYGRDAFSPIKTGNEFCSDAERGPII